MKTLILGVGNLLLGDEGVGVHAARRLPEMKLPPHVKVLEIGTAILDALEHLQEADRVIVLDAMKAQGQPGTIYRISLHRCTRNRQIPSLHGIDLFAVLSMTARTQMPEVLVLGVEPARLDWSMELSTEVSRALPVLLKEVQKIVLHEENKMMPPYHARPIMRDSRHTDK